MKSFSPSLTLLQCLRFLLGPYSLTTERSVRESAIAQTPRYLAQVSWAFAYPFSLVFIVTFLLGFGSRPVTLACYGGLGAAWLCSVIYAMLLDRNVTGWDLARMAAIVERSGRARSYLSAANRGSGRIRVVDYLEVSRLATAQLCESRRAAEATAEAKALDTLAELLVSPSIVRGSFPEL